jgi:hypothetical protein
MLLPKKKEDFLFRILLPLLFILQLFTAFRK